MCKFWVREKVLVLICGTGLNWRAVSSCFNDEWRTLKNGGEMQGNVPFQWKLVWPSLDMGSSVIIPPPHPPENTCSKLRRDMRFVGENWRNIWNQSPTWGCRFEFLDKKPIVWFAGRWAGGRTIWNYACIKQDTSIRLWTRRPKFAIEWDKFTKKVTAWLYLLCLILVHPASSPLPVAFPSVN